MFHETRQVTKDQNIGNIKEETVKTCYTKLEKEIMS
jgi:hypothetical protein